MTGRWSTGIAILLSPFLGMQEGMRHRTEEQATGKIPGSTDRLSGSPFAAVSFDEDSLTAKKVNRFVPYSAEL